LDDSDDDIIMLEESPAPVPEPSAADPPATTHNPSPENTEKVNDLVNDTSTVCPSVGRTDSVIGSESVVGSVPGSARDFDSGSGYKDSESEFTRNSLFNYSKYGTRSKVGEGETLIDSEKPTMPSTYYQCKSARDASRTYSTVDVSIGPSAGVCENVKYSSVGSLDCLGDTEILKTFRGSRITANGKTVNQTISASFDPSNLKCTVCSSAHYILAKGPDDSPPTIIFADQNFVSTLSGGKSCLAIVRLEDASIPELADLAFEILEKHHPPPGTIFMFGSASHLLNAGTTIYTQEWCNMVGNISGRYPDSRILPLSPVIREDCPGAVSRQLIELATWYKTVYANDIMGITSVWDSLIVTLCKTDEDGLDLGYNETYSVAMPAFLAPNAPLRNFKFKTNSSHTTTTGMDSLASKELLSSLIEKLKCTFATYANSEDILLEAPAEPESKLEKKTIYIFGGSNMRSVIPELEKRGFHVIDHTVSGWVPTPANIAKISDLIINAHPSDVVIADLLGNVTHRYAQADGTLAMPFKHEGKYHFEGEIQVCPLSNLKTIMESLKPALSRCRCHLVFTPPLPRHLHDGCCTSRDHCTNIGSEKHAEKMLSDLNSIRTACGSNLENLGIKDFSIPDILKLSMPACAGIPEYAEALKTLMKKDGVHFTDSGYSCLASGLHNHLKTLKPSVQGKVAVASLAVSGTSGRKKQSFYWRGFVSPVGVGRPYNHRAAYLQSHSNPGSAKGVGGGKWRGSTSGASGASGSHGTFPNLHSRTPYMGGRGGKKFF
jgi:hypothetical protein